MACWMVCSLGGLFHFLGDCVKTVGSVLLPNGADTSGPVVAPAILRQTLGVDNTSWTGRGVGVAVIDSGLEMSAEFQNRVTAFYDFTSGGQVATAAYPFDATTGTAPTSPEPLASSGALSQPTPPITAWRQG